MPLQGPYLDLPLSPDDGAEATFILEFADVGNGLVNTGTFDGRAATFTRATTATTIDRFGLVKIVAAGFARSYYDPTTLAYLGYLAEGSRINICLQSEDFSTTWSNSASSESVNSLASPDGSVTADKIIEDGTNATHGMFQGIVVVNTTVYTLSVFAKQGERPRIGLFEGSTTGAQAVFDLAAGTVVSTGGGGTPSATIKSYQNGWYRCAMTFTAGASASQNFNILLQQAGDVSVGSYQGNGTSGAYFWGAQLEAGSFASTYIPTTTASVTRNADVLTYPTSGWYSATASTLFGQYQRFSVSGNNFLSVISDGSGNNRIGSFGSGSAQAYRVTSGGVSGVSATGSGAEVVNTTYKVAIGVLVNDFASYLNAVQDLTDSVLTMPVGITIISVGVDEAGTGVHAFGPISRVAYWPLRLLNATLQSITGANGVNFRALVGNKSGDDIPVARPSIVKPLAYVEPRKKPKPKPEPIVVPRLKSLETPEEVEVITPDRIELSGFASVDVDPQAQAELAAVLAEKRMQEEFILSAIVKAVSLNRELAIAKRQEEIQVGARMLADIRADVEQALEVVQQLINARDKIMKRQSELQAERKVEEDKVAAEESKTQQAQQAEAKTSGMFERAMSGIHDAIKSMAKPQPNKTITMKLQDGREMSAEVKNK